MGEKKRAYLCVSIDTECDKGAAWLTQRPLAFRGVTTGVKDRLEPLFRKRNAKATYLLSPEVMRDDASVEALRGTMAHAELGTHLHGELAEPGAHEPEVTRDFQRDYPAKLEREKLVYLTDLFTRVFEKKPTSFRAGRFGIGESSIGILEDLGYTVESSVTPHIDWSSAGAKGLSFIGAPSQPYRPNARVPKERGDAKILEVPVTIRARALNALPILGKLVEPRWLRPTRGTKDSLVSVARDEIADNLARNAHLGRARPVILNAMFHNVEIIPNASPYAKNEDEANAILGRLDALLVFCERESIPVIGLSDVPEILAA